MMLGSFGVGSGIGVSDGCEGSDATGSELLDCIVSDVVVWAGSAWSAGVGSSWGVSSGVGSGGLSSSVVGIGSDSGLIRCGVSSVIGVPSMVGVGAGVVNSGSSCAIEIVSCADGGLASLPGSSTVSISSVPVAFLSASYW